MVRLQQVTFEALNRFLGLKSELISAAIVSQESYLLKFHQGTIWKLVCYEVQLYSPKWCGSASTLYAPILETEKPTARTVHLAAYT